METSLPQKNIITTYKQAREQGHELLRRNVVEAASYLLVEEGPDALTVRRIAQQLDCSTKIIYTMFKGKEGLADALYVEGSTRFAYVIKRIQRATTLEAYGREVAWAYWDFALANPSYYMVMFCGAIPNFQPSATSISTVNAAFETVVGNIQHYMDEQMLPADDPLIITKALWAPLHGVVSLYLLGHFESLEMARDVFERIIQANTLLLTAKVG